MLPLQGAQVQPMAGELRIYMPQEAAKKNFFSQLKKKRYKNSWHAGFGLQAIVHQHLD